MRNTKTHLFAAPLICASVLAVAASALEYTPDAKMILPKDYREWVFPSSDIGMSYSRSPFRTRIRLRQRIH